MLRYVVVGRMRSRSMPLAMLTRVAWFSISMYARDPVPIVIIIPHCAIGRKLETIKKSKKDTFAALQQLLQTGPVN